MLIDDTSARPRPPRATRRLAWFITGAYWSVMLVALHWPLNWPPGHRRISWDKLIHFSSYGLLAFLVSVSWSATWPSDGRLASGLKRIVVLVMAIAMLGLLDEVTQPLTNRDFEWLDLAADTLGALVGASTHAIVAARMRSVQSAASAQHERKERVPVRNA